MTRTVDTFIIRYWYYRKSHSVPVIYAGFAVDNLLKCWLCCPHALCLGSVCGGRGAEVCNEELWTRTELSEDGVMIFKKLTYSVDIFFLHHLLLARFIVTDCAIHLLACLPPQALSWRVLRFPRLLCSLPAAARQSFYTVAWFKYWAVTKLENVCCSVQGNCQLSSHFAVAVIRVSVNSMPFCIVPCPTLLRMCDHITFYSMVN